MIEAPAIEARAQALEQLAAALANWRVSTYGATEFVNAWRAALALGSFSPRAHEVSEGLLTRVESARHFSGESCSFSVSEMQSAFEALHEKLKAAK